jgi:hypothetical protein
MIDVTERLEAVEALTRRLLDRAARSGIFQAILPSVVFEPTSMVLAGKR